MEAWQAWAMVSAGLAVLATVLAYLLRQEKKHRQRSNITERQTSLELRLLKSDEDTESKHADDVESGRDGAGLRNLLKRLGAKPTDE